MSETETTDPALEEHRRLLDELRSLGYVDQ